MKCLTCPSNASQKARSAGTEFMSRLFGSPFVKLLIVSGSTTPLGRLRRWVDYAAGSTYLMLNADQAGHQRASMCLCHPPAFHPAPYLQEKVRQIVDTSRCAKPTLKENHDVSHTSMRLPSGSTLHLSAFSWDRPHHDHDCLDRRSHCRYLLE